MLLRKKRGAKSPPVCIILFANISGGMFLYSNSVKPLPNAIVSYVRRLQNLF